MTCEKCGRPAENGRPTHWLGCEAVRTTSGNRARYMTETKPGDVCEYPTCAQPKKPWSGRGARPKFCADGHK